MAAQIRLHRRRPAHALQIHLHGEQVLRRQQRRGQRALRFAQEFRVAIGLPRPALPRFKARAGLAKDHVDRHGQPRCIIAAIVRQPVDQPRLAAPVGGEGRAVEAIHRGDEVKAGLPGGQPADVKETVREANADAELAVGFPLRHERRVDQPDDACPAGGAAQLRIARRLGAKGHAAEVQAILLQVSDGVRRVDHHIAVRIGRLRPRGQRHQQAAEHPHRGLPPRHGATLRRRASSRKP